MKKNLFAFLLILISMISVAHASPAMCPAMYDPVCGKNPETGLTRLYSNACIRSVNSALECTDAEKKALQAVEDCQKKIAHNFSVHTGRCVVASSDQDIFAATKKLGLTTTKNLEHFAPNSFITRDEVAAVLTRAIDNVLFENISMTATSPQAYRDADRIPKEFLLSVARVRSAGIMLGDARGFFYPKNHLTTYEALVITARFLNSSIAFTTNNMLNFADKIGVKFDENAINMPITRKDFFRIILAAYGQKGTY